MSWIEEITWEQFLQNDIFQQQFPLAIQRTFQRISPTFTYTRGQELEATYALIAQQYLVFQTTEATIEETVEEDVHTRYEIIDTQEIPLTDVKARLQLYGYEVDPRTDGQSHLVFLRTSEADSHLPERFGLAVRHRSGQKKVVYKEYLKRIYKQLGITVIRSNTALPRDMSGGGGAAHGGDAADAGGTIDGDDYEHFREYMMETLTIELRNELETIVQGRVSQVLENLIDVVEANSEIMAEFIHHEIQDILSSVITYNSHVMTEILTSIITHAMEEFLGIRTQVQQRLDSMTDQIEDRFQVAKTQSQETLDMLIDQVVQNVTVRESVMTDFYSQPPSFLDIRHAFIEMIAADLRRGPDVVPMARDVAISIRRMLQLLMVIAFLQRRLSLPSTYEPMTPTPSTITSTITVDPYLERDGPFLQQLFFFMRSGRSFNQYQSELLDSSLPASGFMIMREQYLDYMSSERTFLLHTLRQIHARQFRESTFPFFTSLHQLPLLETDAVRNIMQRSPVNSHQWRNFFFSRQTSILQHMEQNPILQFHMQNRMIFLTNEFQTLSYHDIVTDVFQSSRIPMNILYGIHLFEVIISIGLHVQRYPDVYTGQDLMIIEFLFLSLMHPPLDSFDLLPIGTHYNLLIERDNHEQVLATLGFSSSEFVDVVQNMMHRGIPLQGFFIPTRILDTELAPDSRIEELD